MKEMLPLPARLLHHLSALARAAQRVCHRLLAATRPTSAPVAVGALVDLARSRPALVAENALLRHQLGILRRSVTRPRCTSADRALLVLLAGRVRTWRQALLVVQPATLLRWHRQLFRGYWRRRSRSATPAHRPPLAAETVALIRAMASANRLWGAKRIRGELLKLDIRVARSTIQKYARATRALRPGGPTWDAFLRAHAGAMWTRDFLPVTDLFFQQVFAFFVVELASRRVVHVGVTRHPTDAWVAQQLREATPVRHRPGLPHPRQRPPVRASLRPGRGDERHRGAAHGLSRAVAERHLRAVPRQRPPRVPGPRPGAGRAAPRLGATRPRCSCGPDSVQ